MLSGVDHDVPDGIGMARLAWTRLPAADGDGAPGPSTSAATDDDLFSGAAVESLDYEVIENYAYREEQVSVAIALERVVLVCGQLSCFVCVAGSAQAQRSKFWVPYYVMLKWLFALLIGVGERSLFDPSLPVLTSHLSDSNEPS